MLIAKLNRFGFIKDVNVADTVRDCICDKL